jgi:hypothetical protein
MALSFALTAGASRHPRFIKARVRFLATSTVFHSDFGANQDIYLAEVDLRGSSGGTLIRLIDEYPPYRPPFSHAILTSPNGTTLKILRDPNCDTAFFKIPLRTVPGDPMALLPERLGYTPKLPQAIEPGTVIPCYRTLR